MYYILLPDLESRTKLISELKEQDIQAVFHYVPLHSSPAGRRFGRAAGALPVTKNLSDRLLRLPLWLGLEEHQVRVIKAISGVLEEGLVSYPPEGARLRIENDDICRREENAVFICGHVLSDLSCLHNRFFAYYRWRFFRVYRHGETLVGSIGRF